MRETPSKMYMYDVVTIDTIVFEVVGEGRGFKSPPPYNRIVMSLPVLPMLLFIWMIMFLGYKCSFLVNTKVLAVFCYKQHKIA